MRFKIVLKRQLRTIAVGYIDVADTTSDRDTLIGYVLDTERAINGCGPLRAHIDLMPDEVDINTPGSTTEHK